MHSCDKRSGERMFSSQCQWYLLSQENLTNGISANLERCGVVQAAVVKCRTCIHTYFDWRAIQFLVIEFYLTRCIQDCLRSVSRSLHITYTIFKWRWDNCKTCFFWIAVWRVWRSKLGYYIITHYIIALL